MDRNLSVAEEIVKNMIPEGIENEKSCYITQNEISALTGLKTRQVRYIVQTLREKGVAICSNDNGYHIATDSKDLAYTLQRLRCQSITLKKTIDSLQKTYDKMMLEEQ